MIEEIGVNLAPGQGGYGQRRDEFRSGARQNRRHRCAALLQPADQVKRLVGGDAAADDQKNTLARQHVSAFDLGSRLWCRGHAPGTQPPCGGSAAKAAQGSPRRAAPVTIHRSKGCWAAAGASICPTDSTRACGATRSRTAGMPRSTRA